MDNSGIQIRYITYIMPTIPLPSQNPATQAFEAFLPKPAPLPSPANSVVQAGLQGAAAGVAAAQVPPVPPSTPTNNGTTGVITGSGTVNNNPIDVNTLERGVNAPDPTALLLSSAGFQNANLSSQISQGAQTTIDSNQQLIDSLLKTQQTQVEGKIPGAQAEVDNLKGEYQKQINSTIYSDKLKEVYDKFQLDQKIQGLNDINNKIVAAKDALDQGLIYEGDRPIRLDLITGRQATLKAQGMATIGTLQASAQVIQGNINLAYSYANATIDALKMDTDRSLNALNTLLKLSNDNLVDLQKQDRDLIDKRMKNLQDGIDNAQKNKDKIMDLVVKYPTAAANGGVNFLDSPQDAVLKMLPTLSQQEQVQLALDQVKLAQAKLTLAQSKSKGSGGSGGTGVSKADQQKFETQLLQGKAGGMPYAEAIYAFGDVLPITYINSVYPQEAKAAGTLVNPQQQVANIAYGDVVNNPQNYDVSIDGDGKVLVNKKSGGGADNAAYAQQHPVLNAAKSVFSWIKSKI